MPLKQLLYELISEPKFQNYWAPETEDKQSFQPKKYNWTEIYARIIWQALK